MIKRELAVFLIVGLLTVAIDFSIYLGLIYLGLENVNIAKGIGFIGGTIFAYFANRFWTFKEQNARNGCIIRFAIVYMLGFGTNIIVNYIGIFALDYSSDLMHYPPKIYISFLLATGVSATLNFLGMKFFVFTDQKTAKPSFST
jgi:putative flippase GtrA